MPRKAIFIYNADSGPFAAMLDSVKKLVGSEGACALCAITHGAIAEKKQWRDIECSLGLSTVYHHRDEIPRTVQSFLREKDLPLPLVLFATEEGAYEIAVSAEELRQCGGDPTCLKDKLETALERFT